MTEQEWLTSPNSKPMLAFLLGKGSDRKLRLFAVGCCRYVSHLMPDDRCRKAAEVVERFADGEATEDDLRLAASSAFASADDNEVAKAGQSFAVGQGIYFAARTASYAAHVSAHEAAVSTNRTLFVASVGAAGDPDTSMAARNAASAAAYKHQMDLLHDIFGNPFCPVAADDSWKTPTVTSLAQAIYDDRTFDRMPILADALQTAGCDNEDILGHCRGSAPHVRGCWVVDLLLRKE